MTVNCTFVDGFLHDARPFILVWVLLALWVAAGGPGLGIVKFRADFTPLISHVCMLYWLEHNYQTTSIPIHISNIMPNLYNRTASCARHYFPTREGLQHCSSKAASGPDHPLLCTVCATVKEENTYVKSIFTVGLKSFIWSHLVDVETFASHVDASVAIFSQFFLAFFKSFF